VQAVVLVGGEGTRLRPLTYSMPKQMLPIAELPMIERVLEQLARHGVSHAVLSLGYKPEVFVEHFSSGHWRDMSLTFAIEPPTLLDTAGAVAFAAREANISETFIAVNGDVLTDLDVTALINFHRARNAEATIALTPVEDPSAFGVVPTDEQGQVEAFIEKPKREEAPTNLINAGTYVLEPSVLDAIPKNTRISIEREVFPALADKKTLFAMASDSYWLDTGTAQKYVQANIDYLRNLRPLPPLPAARLLERNWVLSDEKFGVGVSKSLISVGTAIAPDATVEQSIVGRGVRIDAGAVVRNSVLLDGCLVSERSLVEDSVVGGNAVVGAGAQMDEFSILGFGDKTPEDAIIHAERVGVE
jgi:mannose-1-phosphate guanylyltransferase